MPSSPSRQAELTRLTALPYAHRGLHGRGRIENGRAAFRAAIERGRGIELDVQGSREGDAFVLHDYELGRLSAAAGAVASLAAAELAQVKLKGGEALPSLSEMLDLIGGRVPLLIEVKAKRLMVAGLCASVARALDAYNGPIGVMSFDPRIGAWFARHAPQVLRGLVVTEQGKTRLRGAVERRVALWHARPDFLAYDICDLPSRFAAAVRARGLPVMTWTVRSDAEHARAATHADQIIYEEGG